MFAYKKLFHRDALKSLESTRGFSCAKKRDAQDSSHPVDSRAGNAGNAHAAAGRILPAAERAGPRRLHEQLLRNDELLRFFREGDWPALAATLSQPCCQTARDLVCFRSGNRLTTGLPVRTSLQNQAVARACAAASRGDLYSSHLIQRA